MDRALILSNMLGSSMPTQIFPNYVKPSHTQTIKTKYFSTQIELLYDEFESFSEYNMEFLNEESKILRDVLKLVIVIVDEAKEDVKLKELVDLTRRFEEDGNDAVNLVLYFDNKHDTKVDYDDLHEKMLDEGCFWEIITNDEVEQGEKFGIDRLKELFHTINWSIHDDDDDADDSFESQDKTGKTTSIDENFEKMRLTTTTKTTTDNEDENENKNENENEEELKDVDIMAVLSKIQDFKSQVHSMGLKDDDKHKRILQFIEHLNI